MKTLLFTLLGIFILAILWVRYAPIDRDKWHVDPAEIDEPGRAGLRLIGREAPRFPGDAETVLETFSDVALAEPRVKILDGSIDEGMITFITRSKTFGFADMTTVKAVGEGRLTKLSVASRTSVPNASDWGVNRERLDRWLGEVEQRLGQ